MRSLNNKVSQIDSILELLNQNIVDEQYHIWNRSRRDHKVGLTQDEAKKLLYELLVLEMPKEMETEGLDKYLTASEANYGTGKIVGFNSARESMLRVLGEMFHE